MRLLRLKEIGSLKIAGQKFSQVYFKEMLNPESIEFSNAIEKGIKIEVVEADERTISAAIKNGTTPEINGFPVKLKPRLITTAIEMKTTSIKAEPVEMKITPIIKPAAPDTAPPPPPPSKPLTAAQKKRLKAEEKKRKEAEKKKAAEEKEKAEAEEIGTPPPGA